VFDGVYTICLQQITHAAEAQGPARVQAFLTKPIDVADDGVSVAHLFVKIKYLRAGATIEERTAPIDCTVDERGRVVAVVTGRRP
jgi:hypothetical protein